MDAVPLRNVDLRDSLDSRLPTNQSYATIPTAFKARPRHSWTARTLPPIFSARLAPGQLRNNADNDSIRDEVDVPPSSKSQILAKRQLMAGEHGHGRLYLCC